VGCFSPVAVNELKNKKKTNPSPAALDLGLLGPVTPPVPPPPFLLFLHGSTVVVARSEAILHAVDFDPPREGGPKAGSAYNPP
jgi:hypothetical protein